MLLQLLLQLVFRSTEIGVDESIVFNEIRQSNFFGFSIETCRNQEHF